MTVKNIGSKKTNSDKNDKLVEDKKRYWEGVGRRKTSVARVRIFAVRPFNSDQPKITVNDHFYQDFFSSLEWRKIVEEPLRKIHLVDRLEVSVKVNGGGIRGQAEAIRHGLSRALVEFNSDFRKKLSHLGLLKRDPRVKERRKPGLKKARKAPQWSKR